MKKASLAELRLAQSNTYLFTRGLECGIEAVDRFRGNPAAGAIVRVHKNRSELALRIGRLSEESLQLMQITYEMDDWSGRAAVIEGRQAGVEQALKSVGVTV